jgi:predicted short-subunit dehydrogenase-like oxidoreductase (DUF2520 family)
VIERVHVIGPGRVGSAVTARLRERGVAVGSDARGGDEPDVVLLCVPDTAISDVSRCLTPGHAWVGHVSGATPLAALDPHERRFSLHPLQTFDRSGDPSQFDGAWAAISGETDEALAVARELAELLGLHPFELEVTACTTFDGVTIPQAGRVGWFWGTDRWSEGEFFRYEITQMELVR